MNSVVASRSMSALLSGWNITMGQLRQRPCHDLRYPVHHSKPLPLGALADPQCTAHLSSFYPPFRWTKRDNGSDWLAHAHQPPFLVVACFPARSWPASMVAYAYHMVMAS